MECCKLQKKQFALMAAEFPGSPKFAGFACWGDAEGVWAHKLPTLWRHRIRGGGFTEDDSGVIGGRLRHPGF